MRSVLNPPESKEARFTLQRLYYILRILCIVAPVAIFCSVHFGFQDIYWKECPSPAAGSQPLYSAGFNIVNASFIKSPPLTFTVTVDVPPAKIAAAKTSDEVSKLLKDPNTLAINLSDNENTLGGKQPFGTDCTTTIEISRSTGLAGHSATMINFLWQKGKHVRLIDTKLYSGAPTSPYYKKYPHVSERQLLAQTKWQIVVCLAIAVAVILTTILVKLLLSKRKELSNRKTELANSETKLRNTETELVKTQTKLDKALQAIQSSRVGAYLPIGEDVAEEYQQKTEEETTEEKRFKVALTFPGERRDSVEKIADLLVEALGEKRVFYDKYFEAELARPDLDIYLQKIYHAKSELVVVFLCAEYEKKEWCGLEWRAVRDLIKNRRTSDIMPIRFDDTHIRGLFSIDDYINAKDHTPEQIAEYIIERYQINQETTEEMDGGKQESSENKAAQRSGKREKPVKKKKRKKTKTKKKKH